MVYFGAGNLPTCHGVQTSAQRRPVSIGYRTSLFRHLKIYVYKVYLFALHLLENGMSCNFLGKDTKQNRSGLVHTSPVQSEFSAGHEFSTIRWGICFLFQQIHFLLENMHRKENKKSSPARFKPGQSGVIPGTMSEQPTLSGPCGFQTRAIHR